MRLEGKKVAEHIKYGISQRCQQLRESGQNPTIVMIRVGENKEDIAYQKRVEKNCIDVRLDVKVAALPSSVTEEELVAGIQNLNAQKDVRGILIFRPLPSHLNETEIGRAIALEKDIDCMNPANLSKLFMGDRSRISPCTPEAVIAMLKHYGIPMEGKHVVIINRSLVLGKPLALLFLEENATVSICHSKTKNLAEITKRADIVVTGVGKANFFDSSYFKKETTVIDVGINFLDGRMCGDVKYEAVYEHVAAISPVPGGVGAVTSMILLHHCI